MTPNLASIPDRTEEQAREERARKDIASWYPGRHASGGFGIISGRDGHEVCRCERESERDFILQATRDAIAKARAK